MHAHTQTHIHRVHQPEAQAVLKVTAKPHVVTFGYLTRMMMDRIKIIPPQLRWGKLKYKI